MKNVDPTWWYRRVACSASGKENMDGNVDTRGIRRAAVPPSCVQHSSHFGLLDSIARSCRNDKITYHVKKARITLITTHAFKRTRQSDIRLFESA